MAWIVASVYEVSHLSFYFILIILNFDRHMLLLDTILKIIECILAYVHEVANFI